MGILWKILRNFSKYLNPGLCMVQMEPHDKTWAHCCFLFLQSHYEHQIGVVFQVLTTIGVGIKTVFKRQLAQVLSCGSSCTRCNIDWSNSIQTRIEVFTEYS